MKTYIFDFDYTLADSSKGTIICIKYALEKLNKKIPSNERIKKTIGLSLEEAFKYLSKNITLTERKLFPTYFIQKADEVMTLHTHLFNNVPETIKHLSVAGYKLGIVSTKFKFRIEEILTKENLLQYFDIIIGGESVNNHKPHIEGLLKAINLLAVDIDDVFYIGDSIIDAKTANNAGVKFIASLTGVTKQNDFAEYDVACFINEIQELEYY